MSEDFQSDLNQIRTRLAEIQDGQTDAKRRLAEIESEHLETKHLFAKIESEHRAAKSAILDRQAQLTALAHHLTSLGSLCSELRSDLEQAISPAPDRESSQ
jgi:chromosome segregation ATPase